MKRDIEFLGQVFTPTEIVNCMLKLRRNIGRSLEPSAGNGAFSSIIKDCVAIEIDRAHAPPNAICRDFFTYPLTEKFDTVIGNPPYVRFQDILPATKKHLDVELFDRRSNLYLFFIEKCIRHLAPGGELIFIVPREFAKLTAAKRLNAWMFQQGSITDYIETGDSRIFKDALPNCAIFRFEKNRFDRQMNDGRTFAEKNGQLYFQHLRQKLSLTLDDLFSVKVGAVSGADKIFTSTKGNAEFVCSTTFDDGNTRRMIYNQAHRYLFNFKEQLLNRRIRRFDDSNWWQWGRKHPESTAPRIYVNAKTRRAEPFFLHPAAAFDGSILALFPKIPQMDLALAVNLLNKAVDWESLGFVCDGRFLFAQRSLETCLLPDKLKVLR